MHSVEQVWDALKTLAHDHGETGQKMPMPRAEMMVKRLFAEAHIRPAPPEDIIAMYARELVELSEQFARERSASPAR